MEEQGDIPDREEINPELENEELYTVESIRKASVLATILEAGGTVHIYLPHRSVGNGDEDDADLHCTQYNTHIFKSQGIVFVHGDDEDHWVFGEDIGEFERHYEV